MFPPVRRALMAGSHAAECGAQLGAVYCALLYVAGEDEGINDLGEGTANNPGRDSTALTIVKVDLSTTYSGPWSAANPVITIGSLGGDTMRDLRASNLYIGPFARPVSLGNAAR